MAFSQQLIADVLNVAYDILFVDQPPKHQRYLYIIFHMPEYQGKPLTWAQFKAIVIDHDPTSQIANYNPDSRAHASILKLLNKSGNKSLTELTFANFSINDLKVQPLNQLKQTGNGQNYKDWNYGSKTIEKWYETYWTLFIGQNNKSVDYQTRFQGAKPLFPSDLPDFKLNKTRMMIE
jgi:hypothetical protein